jgi:predicted Zn-ribbon and HTH transcriptional regulator
MGRYFGLGNKTKNMIVSHYWKGDQFCDCHEVMHRYHWEITDEIYSACHCEAYTFHYNENKYAMFPRDIADTDSAGSNSDSDSDSDSNLIVDENDTDKKICVGWESELDQKRDYIQTPVSSVNIKPSTLSDLTSADFDQIINNDNTDNIINNNELDEVFDDVEDIDYTKMNKHAPLWQNNKCIICGYVYNPKNIKNDKKLFDDTYCMN